MGESICLDSSFLVDFLRNKEYAVSWIKENEGKNILATTIINIFELYSGAYKSENKENNLIAIKKFAEKIKILNFSIESAEEAGKQNAIMEKTGTILEKRDLFIGIIALTEGFTIKTNNKKHFDRIKGLRII